MPNKKPSELHKMLTQPMPTQHRSSPLGAEEFDFFVGSPQPVSFIHFADRGQAAEVIKPEVSSASASNTSSTSSAEASSQPETSDDELQFELEM